MAKHILDHADSHAEGSRVSEYVRLDRENGTYGPGKVAKSLYQRPSDNKHSERRAEAYLRIEREGNT